MSLSSKDQITVDQTTDDQTKDDQTKQVTNVKKSKKPRCYCCNKKLKMTELNFRCKCNHVFCQLHLNPHSHQCTFDYLKERRDLIKQKNPKMCIQTIEVK